MSIVSEEEKLEMSIERQKDYCKWCFHHSFGFCENCSLKNIFEKSTTKAEEVSNFIQQENLENCLMCKNYPGYVMPTLDNPDGLCPSCKGTGKVIR